MMTTGAQEVRTELGFIRVWSNDRDHAFQHMVRPGLADRLVFYVQSLADQLVTFQVIGSDQEVGVALNASVFVGEPQNLPPGSGPNSVQSISSVSPDLLGGDWHPWLGLVITTKAVSPTDGGEIKAWAVHLGQEDPAAQFSNGNR